MYQKIKEDFDKVITYSQNIEKPITEGIFEKWAVNKKHYIDIFGGKLIYEYPEKIQFELDEKTKKEKFESFLDFINYYFRDNYEELANYIKSQGQESFFQNITSIDYTTLEGKKIKKGTKLVKTFKYFINNTNSLEDIQNKASQIIQENKIEGTLCLSVHPLDYLSISETTYNWRSCHSLDGEYRAGNLSYMMDKTTIICYLKSGNDMVTLPDFPEDVLWNSKKWRVLLFFSNDFNMIFAGKQYPFETQGGINIVLNDLLPESGLITNEIYQKWSPWNRCFYPEVQMPDYTIELNNAFVPVGRNLKPLREVVKDTPGSKHFNDLLSSSTYKPIFSVKIDSYWSPEPLTNKNTLFEIGEKTLCLRCGMKEVYGGAETMMCEECELEYGDIDNDLIGHCSYCDSRMYVDDAYYIEDEMVCESCYDSYGVICENCGETYYNANTFYDEETDRYYCRWCYNDLIAEREYQEREKGENN